MVDNFIPTKLSALAVWLRIFSDALEPHYERLGISADEFERVKNDALFVTYLATMISQTRATLKSLNQFKDQALKSSDTSALISVPQFIFPPVPESLELTSGIIKNIRQIVRRIKAAKNYSGSLGVGLGIVAGQSAEKAPEDTFPPVKIEALQNDEVLIKFKKYRHQSVRIEMRREDENNFAMVGVATRSPYTDKTKSVNGRVEVRNYRLIYYDNNNPNGVYSPIITISTRP